MAISQTYDWASHATSSGYYVYLEAKEVSYDVAKNTSKVSLYVKLYPHSSTWASSQGCTISLRWNGGEVASGSTDSLLSGQSVAASWSGDVEHGSDGKYTGTVSWSISAGGSNVNRPVSGSSGNHTLKLTDIPRAATITSAVDFKDEQNPTLGYSNPAGSNATTLQACLSFDGSTAHIAYRDIPKGETSYTFNFTAAERQVLYDNTKDTNKKLITYIVKTVIGSNTYYNKAEKYLTIENANPTGSITFTETNSKVIDYIGSNAATTVIKSISNIKAVLTSAGKKSATIKSVNMTCGAASSGGASTYTFNAVAANTINYSITDSRGNTTNGSVPFENFVPYIIPKITSSEFERISLDSNNIQLNAIIECYTEKIGTAINTFTIEYSSSSGKSGTISSYTKDKNEITITDLTFENMVEGQNDTPTFTLTVKDVFSSASASNTIIPIVPTFDAGVSDVQINGDLRTTGAFRVDGRAVLYKGSMNQTLANGSGTAGYMYAFSLKMTGQTYQNQYFTFDILQRNRYGTVRLLFTSSGTAGTCTINKVITTGNITVAYVNSNNTFDFYIQKSEAYDDISIHNLSVGSYMVSVINSLVWKNQTVSSLPSEAKTITPNQDQFPINSIYLSVGSTSPASLFGGSWTQLKDRFLLAAGDTYTNGATGGAATVAITKAQMPRHNHANGDEYGSGHRAPVWNYGSGGDRLLIGSGNGYTISTPIYEGKGEAHNNMPPYLVVYVWKRTA